MGSVSRYDDLVIIDGTADSNSGQVFRMVITLSAITLKPVRIENIWATKVLVNKRGKQAPDICLSTMDIQNVCQSHLQLMKQEQLA